MLNSATPHRALTLDEYVEYEETSTLRHEYVAGELFTRADSTVRHNQITLNVMAALRPATDDGACRAYAMDVRLRVADDAVYYPDIMVVCNEVDADERWVTHPCLVVEVAAPNTEATDRREKLFSYRRLPSVMAYLIVYQDERRVVHHWCDAHGDWWSDELTGEGHVRLACLDMTVQLGQIYRRIT